MSPRERRWRYGACIAVVLAGVACGALISGTAGGTGATVLVGIGLVGVVSLIFYEVGLTEDRDRQVQRDLAERADPPPQPPSGGTRHQVGRTRGLERGRGHRRRLP